MVITSTPNTPIHPQERGVITGCNQDQEWLLKWWWAHYSRVNTFPVTFFDFGMSKSARLWCEKRGQVQTVSPPPSYPLSSEEDTIKKKHWEELYGPTVWKARKGWQYKPIACHMTPYPLSIWVDLDCKVRKNLTSLFERYLEGMGMVKEVGRGIQPSQKKGYLLPGETLYNTGVIVFKKGDALIKQWEEKNRTDRHLFLGDQDLLSRIIYLSKTPITTLPSIYNEHAQDGGTQDGVILHFVGDGGKNALLKTFNQMLAQDKNYRLTPEY